MGSLADCRLPTENDPDLIAFNFTFSRLLGAAFGRLLPVMTDRNRVLTADTRPLVSSVILLSSPMLHLFCNEVIHQVAVHFLDSIRI